MSRTSLAASGTLCNSGAALVLTIYYIYGLPPSTDTVGLSIILALCCNVTSVSMWLILILRSMDLVCERRSFGMAFQVIIVVLNLAAGVIIYPLMLVILTEATNTVPRHPFEGIPFSASVTFLAIATLFQFVALIVDTKATASSR